MGEARTKAALAKAAAPTLARAARSLREDAIRRAAAGIREHADDILAANARDLERARKAGMSAPLQDRLLLDEARIAAIADSSTRSRSRTTARSRRRRLHAGCGLRIEKVTVPLGVVAMVYEARPNVTADAFALCIRSGNACVLKGGSAASASCVAIADVCRAALGAAGTSRRRPPVHRGRRGPHPDRGAARGDGPRRRPHPARRGVADPRLRGGGEGPRHRDRHRQLPRVRPRVRRLRPRPRHRHERQDAARRPSATPPSRCSSTARSRTSSFPACSPSSRGPASFSTATRRPSRLRESCPRAAPWRPPRRTGAPSTLRSR